MAIFSYMFYTKKYIKNKKSIYTYYFNIYHLVKNALLYLNAL